MTDSEGLALLQLAREMLARQKEVTERYDLQEFRRIGGNSEHARNNWTPKQRRRMKKKLKNIPLSFNS